MAFPWTTTYKRWMSILILANCSLFGDMYILDTNLTIRICENVVDMCKHTYMHTCIHIYMHTCIHAYMHTCIHTYIHTYIRTYVHTYIRTYVHTYIRTYVHTYIRTYVHTYIRTYVHRCIRISIYLYIYNIYIYALYWDGAKVYVAKLEQNID